MLSVEDRSGPSETLGDLVTRRPGAARVLEAFGLDYCCGGQRTLAEACATDGVSVVAVADALVAVGDSDPPDWAHMDSVREVSIAGGERRAPQRPSLRRPISVMLSEHDAAGRLLVQLRSHSGDLAVPDDACASYQALYEGLAELEADTHLHVHKENNVLFPAVLALEERVGTR